MPVVHVQFVREFVSTTLADVIAFEEVPHRASKCAGRVAFYKRDQRVRQYDHIRPCGYVSSRVVFRCFPRVRPVLMSACRIAHDADAFRIRLTTIPRESKRPAAQHPSTALTGLHGGRCRQNSGRKLAPSHAESVGLVGPMTAPTLNVGIEKGPLAIVERPGVVHKLHS